MALKVRITIIDVKDLAQEKDRTEGQDENGRHQERIVKDHENVNAIEIERGIEMEGECQIINFVSR